ncbi:MAG TPA: hypothetical protein VGD60_17435 [Candidatus Acidoferrales bacterium]
MAGVSKFGRYIFALAALAFGVILLLHLASAAIPEGGFPFSVASHFWAWAIGVIWIVAGVGLMTEAYAPAALLLAAVLLLRAVMVCLPLIFVDLHKPNPWGALFELLGIAGAALVIGGGLGVKPGRALYTVPLIGFATQHFMYAPFVAALVPSWIPGHLFFAYFVGIALCAGALAILTGVGMRAGALLLGLMFFSWVFILHLPRAFAAPHTGAEWTSAFNALAMAGGAFVIAALGQASDGIRRPNF